MKETKYHKGDVVIINNIDWIVKSITMRFGITLTYGLEYEDMNGDMNHLSIETGSLETLIKLGE